MLMINFHIKKVVKLKIMIKITNSQQKKLKIVKNNSIIKFMETINNNNSNYNSNI